MAAPLVCDQDHTSNVHLDKPPAKKKKLKRTSSVPLPAHQASPEKQTSLIEVSVLYCDCLGYHVMDPPFNA